MKNNKWNKKWIVLLAALVILILLLTMCTARCSGQGGQEPSADSLAVPTTEETAASETAAETTAVTTEATTEPTEETTEPTEETTAPTTSSADTDSSDEEEVEDDIEETEPIEIPDPGTAENPYVEVLGGYPGTVTSVSIPAGKGISYVVAGSAGSVVTIESADAKVVLNGTTYTADETTGVLTLDLSKVSVDPVVEISNSGTDAAAYVVKFAEGLGGAGNPEILEDISLIDVHLPEADANGYYYQWVSTITGTVELTAETILPEEPSDEEPTGETTAGDGTAEEEKPPVLDVLVTIGEESFRLSECEDGKLVFDVTKGEKVLIQTIAVPGEDGTYPKIDAAVHGTLLPALGTAENPEPLESIETVIVSLEEGDLEGYHYQWTPAVSGTLTLASANADLELAVTVGETVYKLSETDEGASFDIPVNRNEPVVIQLIAKAGEDGILPAIANATVAGAFLSAPGTPANPAVLESIETAAISLEEGNPDGYTLQWTAAADGTLTFQPESVSPETVSYELALTNETTALLSESLDGTVGTEVQTGDVVTILLTAVSDEAGAYPAARIILKGTFTAAPGSSAENPMMISDTAAATSISLEARETVYLSGMFHEMTATVEGASGVSVAFDGTTAWANPTGVAEVEFPEAGEEAEPLVFSVTSKNAQELTVSFAYPAGHARNPAQLAMGENKITLEEDDADGYLFTWTADCAGFLTVAMDEKAQWQYTIENLTAGTVGETHTSGDEVLTASETVEVAQGDTLRITVKTFNPADPEAMPAGKLTVSAGFYDPLLGTAAKPIALDAAENTVNTITVPAGQTLYYSAEADGMILSFSGRDVTVRHKGIRSVPENGSLQMRCEDSLFVIENAGETDQTCKLTFAYPLGHRENPGKLVMGENKAVLEEGNLNGYAFVWTAEGTGELTVTMQEDANWQYILCNETTGVEGVVHTSEDEPAAAAETVRVTKGDRILVIVNTFDLAHPLKTPAGEVIFTAAFVDPTLGMEENPVWLNLTDEITIPAGKTMYCTAKANGMIMTLTGEHITVSHNGTEYGSENGVVTVSCHGAGTFEHPVFVITNTGETESVCSVRFDYPVGHFMNPDQLKLEKNTAVLESGNECGYVFLWKADRDGALTITMETQSGWQYAIRNLTAGINGEIHCAEDEEPVICETVQVSRGDEIRIVVNTSDPTAAGEICFSAKMETPVTEETPEE